MTTNSHRLWLVRQTLARQSSERVMHLGTWLAENVRTGESAGCPVGFWLTNAPGGMLGLIPINFTSQIKCPEQLNRTLTVFPTKHWRHYTLALHEKGCEAYGMTALCLYFGICREHALELFWPNREHAWASASSLVDRLDRFIETVRFERKS